MQQTGDTDAFDDPALARNAAGLGPFGKCDHELKVRLDEHTYDLLLRECARVGVVPGVFARELIAKRIHGRTISELIAERMSRDIGGEGPVAGPGEVARG